MRTIFLCLLILPQMALAHAGHDDDYEMRRLEHNGVFYTVRLNAHGAVLEAVTETIYMGKECDVVTDRGARGTWRWSNAGFSIDLPNRRLAFPRTDAPVENALQCLQ